MKKSLILFVPICVLLVSCEKFVVGYTKDPHSAGLDHSMSSNNNGKNSYEYFAGDFFEEGNVLCNITFKDHETASNIAKDDVAPILTFDTPVSSFMCEVSEASYVGTKEGIGLFIGADSSYVDGYLSLTLSHDVVNIVIEATPYYYESNGFEEESQLVVDDEVAIAINNTRYIKVLNNKSEDGLTIKSTTCSYHLSSPSKEITIKVGPKRAFIKSIKLFHS